MSAKWRRSLAWDDAFFPGWAWPIKAGLRALSSIWLAVLLLTGISVYSILASIPLGLLMVGAQWLVLAAAVLIPAFVAAALTRLATKKLIAAAAAVLVVGVAWWFVAWPRMSPTVHEGASWRLFDAAAQEFASVTIRRLPSVELTELEFYSAWPMQLMLGLFIVNMVTATVRRIEFNFLNIGVLTVHTGIVLIALGSVYYQRLKLEGDVLLHARPTATGQLEPGPAATTFYDNTKLTLYARQRGNWEQRPITGVPRYNDRALDVLPLAPGGETVASAHDQARRPLIAPGSEGPSMRMRVGDSTLGGVDPDIRFEIVGYATYAEPQTDWIEAQPEFGESPSPLRIVYLTLGDRTEPDFSFILKPAKPDGRLSVSQLMGVEYTIGMPDERFRALAEPIESGASHGLVVSVPEAGVRTVLPARVGVTQMVAGYQLTVSELLEQPPFPIITEGYAGATSSVALIEVTTPDGETYTRYAYHRFPEIDQDILGQQADGRPNRRDADPSLRIGYIDGDQLQVYIDERPETGRVRAIIRLPGGRVRVSEDLPPDAELADILGSFDAPEGSQSEAPKLSLRIAHRWAHAKRFERPVPVPELDREGRFIGTHDKAMLAVRVTADRPATDPIAEPWSTVVWLPFTRYLSSQLENARRVRVPGNPEREVSIAFGRRQHPLGDFALSLLDFEMIPYEHGGPPRDFRSWVRVTPFDADLPPFEAEVSLNSPLRAPIREDTAAPAPIDFIRGMVIGLSPRQLKLSQAGWDATMWRESEAEIGTPGSVVERPYVMFTILGVGNNPGISVIAVGSVLMALGIPWAFYVKPVLLKRRKERLARDARERAASRTTPGDPRPGPPSGSEQPA